MPKKLDDCVEKVKARNRTGNAKVNPWAVCVASTGLSPRRGGKSAGKGGKK